MERVNRRTVTVGVGAARIVSPEKSGGGALSFGLFDEFDTIPVGVESEGDPDG